MWKTVGLGVYLAILSIYDIRTRRIPVIWLVAGGAAAVCTLGYLCFSQGALEFMSEGLKSLWPGLLMLVIARVSGKTGYGDGCVLLVTGGILGSAKSTAVFMMSLLFAAVAAAILLMWRRVGRNYKLPFVPFLAISVCLLELV